MVEDNGFLSRWSRRKAVARTNPAKSEATPVSETDQGLPDHSPVVASEAPPAVIAAPNGDAPPTGAEAPAPLTLADVAKLGRDSDYSAFVGRGVAPDVRNAALKQLFTDPHYNVMDGLDIYIDDYGKPDPVPPGMLRQMTQSVLLGLFDNEDKAEAGAAQLAQSQRESPREATGSEAAYPPDQPEPASDEDPDLRLQPDDDARRAESGAGPVEDPRRQR